MPEGNRIRFHAKYFTINDAIYPPNPVNPVKKSETARFFT
jgi:hypothetical protein